MTEHTPGPWSVTVEHLLVDLPEPHTIYDMRVCRVNGDGDCEKCIAYFGGPVEEGEYSDERKAEAHLIAAAPELLEACKGLVDMIDEYNLAKGGIVEESREAIAKAETE